MKKTIDEMNWRGAFRDTPAECHEAAMRAARSVRERPAARRAAHRLRPVLIAALMILAMSSVAMAAGKLLGWFDYLDQYADRSVPQAAIDALPEPSGEVWSVGPLRFAVRELLADRHMALCTTAVSTGDGQQALLCGEPFDAIGTTPSGEALARQLGLPPETTWTAAAAELHLPLYSVRAIFDADPAYMTGNSMEALLYNEDGSASFFNQAMLNADAVPDEFPVPLFLYVARLDPATGEPIQQWTDRARTVTLRVGSMLEARDYHPQGAQTLDGYVLNAIHAQRYATGAYLSIQFTAPAEATKDQCPPLYDFAVLDGAGQNLPAGMSLSDGFDLTAWPQIVVTKMIGVDALPETIQISDGRDAVILQ